MRSVTLFTAPQPIMLIVLMLLVGASASAQVPGRVPFQGLLLDAGGAPVNGAVDLDFELHDALSGGTSLWSETHLGVTVVDGVYSVDLGSVTPLSSGILGAGTAFLEIAVDGETLVPRTQFLSVPYALVSRYALASESVGSVSSSIVEQMIEHFPFDGQEPGNLHPDEGVLDSDGDGIANFVDPDNDNDGLPDSVEFANGTALNLVTPSISMVSPSTITRFCSSTLTVSGLSLETATSVSFGSESPTPYDVSPTQFSIDVTAQSGAPSATVGVVIASGESTSSQAISLVDPDLSVTGVVPVFTLADQAGSLQILGSDFCAGTTVAIGSQTLVPTSITATSLTVDYAPAPAGDTTIEVIHPSGLSESIAFTFRPEGTKIIFVTESPQTGDFGSVAAGDAICQAQATAAGLTGTFRAWLSDAGGSGLPSSPATTFDQSVGPYVLVDGSLVANGWADLTDGEIAQPIGRTASGNLVTNGFVWTGTEDDGTPASFETCAGWAESSTAQGMVGSPLSTLNWTTVFASNCGNVARLYCFEQ